jgi:hypothetical protein
VWELEMDGTNWGSFYWCILNVATTMLVILLAMRGEKAVLNLLGVSCHVNFFFSPGAMAPLVGLGLLLIHEDFCSF